jgi:hypothetical protein
VLLDAEVEELCPQLWLHHADVLVSAILKVVKLKPKTHYFVVEVGARLYKLYVQVFWRFASCRSCDLHLLLDYMLFLLFQLVYEIMG